MQSYTGCLSVVLYLFSHQAQYNAWNYIVSLTFIEKGKFKCIFYLVHDVCLLP